MRVVLGVCAGIAAYKSILVIRSLQKAGADVFVVPSPDALRFVGKETFQAISGHPVATSLFEDDPVLNHVEIMRNADLLLIVPATANTIAKLSHGQCDNLLTACAITATCPVIIAPAMHTQMYNHPATIENLTTLKNRGVHIIAPETGELACGDQGIGRLADPETIVNATLKILHRPSNVTITPHNLPLKEKQVLICAGGTQEPIDPVRYISNYSTGRMGLELAKAAAQIGATVQFVSANIHKNILAEVSDFAQIYQVQTAQEVYDTMLDIAPNAQLVIMAAAVADYRPAHYCDSKIKKTNCETFTLEIEKTPDVLKALLAQRETKTSGIPTIIGFAAETGQNGTDFIEFGKQKARTKGADLLVVNQVGVNLGFGDVQSCVIVINKEGKELQTFQGDKTKIAAQIMNFFTSN